MKKLLFFTSFLSICIGCYSVSNFKRSKLTSIPFDQRLLIAVVDFSNTSGDAENDNLIKSISGKLIYALSNTGRFRVVERQKFEAVLEELKLQMTGIMAPESVQQVGALLGVDAVVLGELSSVKYMQGKQSIGIFWTENLKTEASFNARIVIIKTGEVRATAEAATFVNQRTWVAFWVARLGRKISKQASVQTCIDIACKKMAFELAEKNQ